MKKFLLVTFVECSNTNTLKSKLNLMKLDYDILNIPLLIKSKKYLLKKNFLNYHSMIISGSCKYSIENKKRNCTNGLTCKIINRIKTLYKFFNDKPILGICYGMELLAFLNGAKIIKFSTKNPQKKNYGQIEITINKDKIFHGLSKFNKFFHNHKKLLIFLHYLVILKLLLLVNMV